MQVIISSYIRNKSSLIWLTSVWIVSLITTSSHAQSLDTIRIKVDQVLILSDTIYVPQQDTTFLLPDTLSYKIKANPYYRSDAFYDSLKTKANRSRITRELYKMLVRPPAKDVYESDKAVESEQYFQPYTNKIIKTIKVLQLPLLDGNVSDTTQLSRTQLSQILSKAHTPTRASLIKKNVLFKEGEEVDPFVFADSERLLRALNFIEDARIYLLTNPNNEQEAAVTIVVKDRFPWGINLGLGNLSRYDIQLANRNLLGTGNLLWGKYVFNADTIPQRGYEFHFVSRNIANTFTRLEFDWADHWKANRKVFRIIRDFVSPEIKYGGEIEIGENAQQVSQVFLDSLQQFNIHFLFQDVWLGRAFVLPGNNHRQTLRLGLRYLHHDFLQRPEVSVNSNERYHNRHFWLGSIALQKINFLKTRYILSYGITEDVPVGYSYGLQWGKDNTEFGTKMYWGGDVRWASYYSSFGYLYFWGEAGTFQDGSSFKNTLIKLQGRYFSPLIRAGRSKIRNFANLYYTMGENLSAPETVNLGSAIDGLSALQAYGEKYFAAHLESVWFTPWYFYGFRFAPLFHTDFGYIKEGRGVQEFSNYQHFVTKVGGGFRVRNESLVFQTLEVDASYFPKTLPGSDKWWFNITFSSPLLFRSISPFRPRIISLE